MDPGYDIPLHRDHVYKQGCTCRASPGRHTKSMINTPMRHQHSSTLIVGLLISITGVMVHIIRISLAVHRKMANVSVATNSRGGFLQTGQTTRSGLLRTVTLPLGSTVNTSDTATSTPESAIVQRWCMVQADEIQSRRLGCQGNLPLADTPLLKALFVEILATCSFAPDEPRWSSQQSLIRVKRFCTEDMFHEP